MAILNQKKILNVIPGITPQLTVHCSQSDEGSTVEFELYAGSVPFESDGTASVQGIRKDGTGFGPEAVALDGSTATVTLSTAMTGAAGPALCEITITETGGSVSTANFALLVEEAAFPNGPLVENSVDVYQQILQYVQSFPASAAADATAKVAAEAALRQAADQALQASIDAEATARAAAVSAEATARAAADTQLQTEISGLQNAVGGPNVALTAADFTDITKVYVVAGTIPGMTTGDWYYWNGSAWVSGGVYNSTAVQTDPTLSVSGMAADAAACGDLKSALTDVESYLGYSRNYFDGRGLTTTNPTNWTILSTKTSVTITHNNSYTTGTPTIPLNIPVGEYVFHATHSAEYAFYLYIDGVYSSTIKDGSSLVIESDKTYMLEALNIPSGTTQTITDISITSASTGVIQSIENDIDAIENTVNEISENVTVTLSVEMESDTASTVATVNGIESAGSNYHTVKFPVKGSDVAHVSVASTNWGNLYYIVCDSNDSVVAVSESSPSSSTITALHDFDVTIPPNGSYLIVNYLLSHSVTPVASVTREVFVPKGVSYPFAGKKWVAIGDSLTEKNDSASKNYVDWVCEKLGLTCVNMGVGGTGYMRGYDANKAFYQRVADIPNDADIITIFGSGNDLGLYNQIGTPSDTGTSTICGCINTTLDYIANNFTTVPVVVIAPTIWKDQVPTENTPMTLYVQFLEEIAKKRSLHFLNLYSGGGLNPNNAAQLNALFYHHTLDGNADGVHPNNAGHKIIAPKIKNAIECALIAE